MKLFDVISNSTVLVFLLGFIITNLLFGAWHLTTIVDETPQNRAIHPSKIFQASLKSYDASDDRPMKFNSMQKSYDTNRKSITGGQRPGHGG